MYNNKYLESTNKFIFEMKYELDRLGGFPKETIAYFLGSHIQDAESIKNLQDQLTHALKTGEYLETIKVFH